MVHHHQKERETSATADTNKRGEKFHQSID